MPTLALYFLLKLFGASGSIRQMDDYDTERSGYVYCETINVSSDRKRN